MRVIPVAMRRHVGNVSFLVAVSLVVMGIWLWRDPPLLKACLGGALALISVADVILPPRATRLRR